MPFNRPDLCIGILIIGTQNRQILDANNAALQMIEAERDEVVGQLYNQFFQAARPGTCVCPLEDPVILEKELDCFLVQKSGCLIPINKSSSILRREDSSVLVESFLQIPHIPHEETRENDQRTLAEALIDSANVINQSLNLRDVLERIIDVIGKVVPHDSANIMLLEDDGHCARMTAWRGYDKLVGVDLHNQLRKLEEVPNLVLMAKTQKPIVLPDTRTALSWVQLDESRWIRSYVSAPICQNGKTIGFINLNSSKPNFYKAFHAQRLIAFAGQAAIAIENARLYECAQQELAERKKAEEALQQAMNVLEERVEQRTAELKNANQLLRVELERRRQAEQTLEEERALLALRVEERTAELSLANAELEKAAKMKDAFLASMSHELRTPLNAVLNISEALAEGTYGSLLEAQTKALRTITDSGEHLLSLINDILDLSKIGAGKLDLQMDKAPVQPICGASIKFIQEQARKKNLNLTTEIDPRVNSVWCDPRRLKQILVNLLSNAGKFTPEGGSIGLNVRGEPEKKRLHFSVWDSGIGIPPEKCQNLFKPFIQLDNRLSRNFEGTGLGLALVHSLVELHGGGIVVESSEGAGSRFTVSLHWDEKSSEGPFDENAAENAPVLQAQTAPPIDFASVESQKPAILIRRCLNELGIQFSAYWFEKEAVERVLQSGYDIFVLDLRSLTKGREILNFIQQSPETTYTSILILTQTQQSLEELTLPAGTTFLPYPFTTEQVRQVIRRTSPQGTASLVHKAAIFIERPEIDSRPRPMVLLVDNNQNSVRLLTNYLRALSYRLSFAASSIEALESARRVHPDAILFNLQRIGAESLETIQRIRRDPKLKSTSIIVYTALTIPGDQARCCEAGADVFLGKPFDLRTLPEIIESHIKIKRSH